LVLAKTLQVLKIQRSGQGPPDWRAGNLGSGPILPSDLGQVT
jgi:hypothetical protein